MLETRLDHLVVVSPSLAVGVEWVRQRLGLAPSPGGEHPPMGTHNALLRLGETVYLEVIAVNPEAPPPGRPRWFALDRLGVGDAPRLASWVARTNDIVSAAGVSPFFLGPIESMSRGSLRWLITIPEDGDLPAGGVAPTLIQWQTDRHPAGALEERGCSLAALEGHHPDAAQLQQTLDRVGFSGAFEVTTGSPARLIGHIRTPSGVMRL